MSERDGKWEAPKCFLASQGQSECDGVMELKDVTLSSGSFEMLTEDGVTFPIHKDPILEKTWVCNKCGFVFYE